MQRIYQFETIALRAQVDWIDQKIGKILKAQGQQELAHKANLIRVDGGLAKRDGCFGGRVETNKGRDGRQGIDLPL